MATTLRYDTTATATFADLSGVVPATSACKFVSADGIETACGTVSLPTVNTTVGLISSVTPASCVVSDPWAADMQIVNGIELTSDEPGTDWRERYITWTLTGPGVAGQTLAFFADVNDVIPVASYTVDAWSLANLGEPGTIWAVMSGLCVLIPQYSVPGWMQLQGGGAGDPRVWTLTLVGAHVGTASNDLQPDIRWTSTPAPAARTYTANAVALDYTGDWTATFTPNQFTDMWIQTAEPTPQYRQIASTVAVYSMGHTTLTLTLSTSPVPPFDAWQTGTPADGTMLGIYRHGVATPLVTTYGPSGSTKTNLRLLNATGVVPGDPYLVVAGGVRSVVTCERVTDNTVSVSPALDVTPADGSTFQGLKMSSLVPALGKNLLGPGHRLIWTYAPASGDSKQHVESVQVVRWVPDQPISGADVRAIVAAIQPSTAGSRSQAYYDAVAQRVARRVEQALDATGRRQSCYGDPNAFAEPGRTCARLYLADDGIYPPNMQPDQYLKSLDIRLENELRNAVAGLAFDADGDGTLSSEELKPKFFAFKVRL